MEEEKIDEVVEDVDTKDPEEVVDDASEVDSEVEEDEQFLVFCPTQGRPV